MKRQVQELGVRKWSGNDLLELQGEGLSVLDAFFSQYGNCVIVGCSVTSNSIAPGLVSIEGRVMPFEGVTNVEVYPVYLVAEIEHVQREYADNVVRDIALKYSAKMVQALPEADHLTLSEELCPAFFNNLRADWKDDMIKQLLALAETDTAMQESIRLLKLVDVVTGKSISALEKKMPAYIDHTPTVTDDGYGIGVEVWTVLENGSKVFWKCHDNTKGAAVWKRSGEGGGGGNVGGAVYLTGQTNFSKATIIIKEGVLV